MEQAPSVQTLNSYKLTFGLNKDLEITEKVKVFTGLLHSDNHSVVSKRGERLTLVYKGLASYTFQLRRAKLLTVPNNWFFNGFGQELKIPLRFYPKKYNKDGSTLLAKAEGTGKDDNDKDVNVTLLLDDYSGSVWYGYYDDGEN